MKGNRNGHINEFEASYALAMLEIVVLNVVNMLHK